MRRAQALEATPVDGPLRMDTGALAAPPLTSAPSANQSDQRRTPRRRVLLSALVVYQDFNITFRCGIRDVSNDGARLKAPPGLLIPTDFLLIDILAAQAYEASTAWRRYPYIGVSFRSAMALTEPTTRLARRLRTLWLGAIN